MSKGKEGARIRKWREENEERKLKSENGGQSSTSDKSTRFEFKNDYSSKAQYSKRAN